ncbi:O-antigen ligase family protein [Alteromonas facilis]|uniref:O-antigen ligase family protein n=1 Tax=Alteromonas facilis TaxID=2048004 RepID=UPI001F0C875C|nr:O-antigen ligase family protein [Alteromonas facilis]
MAFVTLQEEAFPTYYVNIEMSPNNKSSATLSEFWFLKLPSLWAYFKSESIAFKAICCYMFVEYFRPQSIFPIIDFLPWAQLFLIIALAASFTDETSRLKWSKLHTFILLFAVTINLSILTAFDSSWSTEHYIFFAQWIIIFFIITSIVTTKERLYVFFLVIFLCSIKIAFGTARTYVFRGFSFTSWGLMGPSGYFQNSGELAILMLTLFPVAFYLYRNRATSLATWEKWVLIIAVVSPLLTILGASSRGAQIALAVQFTVMFWKKIFKPKALIMGGIVISLAWQVLPEEQKERFTSIGKDKTSIQRTLYWKNGWEMMKEHPALGVGYHNFIPYYTAHFPQDILYKNAELPHNILIQIGTDAGFTALLFYLLIISTILFTRTPKHLISCDDSGVLLSIWRGNKMAVLGFFIAGQFVTVGYYPFLWISASLHACLVFVANSSKSASKT